MKIALIQSDLYWEDAAKNRMSFESKINQIDSDVNLIVLPEMFSTGFTMNASEVAETMQGETVLWMQAMYSRTPTSSADLTASGRLPAWASAGYRP